MKLGRLMAGVIVINIVIIGAFLFGIVFVVRTCADAVEDGTAAREIGGFVRDFEDAKDSKTGEGN